MIGLNELQEYLKFFKSDIFENYKIGQYLHRKIVIPIGILGTFFSIQTLLKDICLQGSVTDCSDLLSMMVDLNHWGFSGMVRYRVT